MDPTMLALLADPTAWFALLTLTAMEIVLGIDNIVFLSVLVSHLPATTAKRARQIGLAMALIFRIALLLLLTWIIGLTEPVFAGFGVSLSWKDIVLIAGGVFLVYKATHEMHKAVENGEEGPPTTTARGSLAAAIVQIVLIDLVFSVDSIVTAIGMARDVEVMIAAVVIAVIIMYVASGAVANFISAHPTTKMLALAFLLLIGVTLVADGFGFHIDRGYVYAAMAFSSLVEAVNIFATKRHRQQKTAKAPAIAQPDAEPVARKPRSSAVARAQARPKSAPRKAKS
jgi:predicted tellurium resistance membrane protein TerC